MLIFVVFQSHINPKPVGYVKQQPLIIHKLKTESKNLAWINFYLKFCKVMILGKIQLFSADVSKNDDIIRFLMLSFCLW